HVGAQSYDLGDISTDALGVAPRPAIVDLNIAACAHGPAELPQIIKQRGNFSLPDRVVFKPRDHHADPPHPAALLRPRRERPGCPRAAEQRYEFASFHSITSSACSRSAVGVARAIAFTVLRLRTNSKVVGCSIGKSYGLAPRAIRSTYSAARRYIPL